MSVKRDTASKSKLERRQITLDLDAEAKALAGESLNAETYLLVMRARDQAAISRDTFRKA